MVAPDQRIFRQIEASADFYGPATYRNLLTYYHDLVIQDDSQSGSFIPLSQVSTDPRKRILFAIGILPPAINVTGRLLDRSASIIGLDPDALPEVPNLGPPTSNVSQAPDVVSQDGNNRQNLVQDKQFWICYVEMCRRLGVEPRELAKVILHESGWNPNAVAIRGKPPRPVAKGLTQLLKPIAVKNGMTPEQWDNMETMPGKQQLPFIESYMKKAGVKGKKAGAIYAKNAGGYSLPGFGFGYMSSSLYNSLSASQQEAIKASVEKVGGTIGYMFKAYDQNAAVDTKAPGNMNGIVDPADLAARVGGAAPTDIAGAIDEAEAAIDAGATGQQDPLPIGGDAEGGAWKGDGEKDASKAKEEQEKLEGSPLLNSAVGQQLLAAQKAQIQAIQQALDKMKRTPPLMMLVNPNKFGVKGEKIVQDGNWGRNGHIIEFWGDQQDKISASGRVAGFFAMDTQNANMPGLTRWARNFSAAWQNFQSLFQLYRSNGAMFLPDPFTENKLVNLTMMGSIYIYYDNTLYIGSFDSFSMTEGDTAPHTVDYSFEFTVRASFLLDRTDDQFTYGAPELFRIDVPATNLAGDPVPSNDPTVANIPPLPEGLAEEGITQTDVQQFVDQGDEPELGEGAP